MAPYPRSISISEFASSWATYGFVTYRWMSQKDLGHWGVATQWMWNVICLDRATFCCASPNVPIGNPIQTSKYSQPQVLSICSKDQTCLDLCRSYTLFPIHYLFQFQESEHVHLQSNPQSPRKIWITTNKPSSQRYVAQDNPGFLKLKVLIAHTTWKHSVSMTRIGKAQQL